MSAPYWAICVIVTYNPNKETFQELISQLLKSPVSICIVDNKFSEESTRITKAICRLHSERVTFIELDNNYGIAKAINLGIETARNQGYDFAMLFDQDSIPRDGLMEEMRLVTEQLRNAHTDVAAIGPRLVDPRSGSAYKFARLKWGIWQKLGCDCGKGQLVPCEFINSSGSLIFLRHWDAIGPFNEDFFIDHVETEWYMRIRYLDLKCYGYCTRSYLEHQMGDDVCRYWLGKWRFMPRRAPERHYTIIRNSIWMWRFRHTPSSWIANSVMKTIFTLFYFSLFDKERRRQFHFILKGIRDGLLTRPHQSYAHLIN